MPDDRLEVAAGFATERGPRADNQDFGGVHLGSPEEQRLHGVIAAIADGVGGARGGRVAAELAVRSFIDGYLDQKPLSGVAASATAALRGFNRWLHSTGRSDPKMEGAAATFTAMILRGREATVVHVGDSRAWHWRDGMLTRLTDDHVLNRPGQDHMLFRAVGIESDVKLDVRVQALEPHDRLLLTTDGAHRALNEGEIGRILARRASPDADAQAIVQAALAADGQDNATAIIIDVIRTGALDWASLGARSEALPMPPPPKAGEIVDDWRLERQLADGRHTRLFVARDRQGGEPVVLKFPKPGTLPEADLRAILLREAFIGQHVDSPHLGRTLPVDPARQSRLYNVQPFYEGGTLHGRLSRGEPIPMAEGVAIAACIARAVMALHRQGVIHRDIKPDNVILTADGGVKLIDLGVAKVERVEETGARAPGTPGFVAPEMFAGDSDGDEKTDQFALGVTLYRLFADEAPWGAVDPDSRPPYERPTSLTRRRPDAPAWLEAAIMRAIAPDPAHRWADVQDLVQALESGGALAVEPPREMSLLERDPVRFWKGVSLVLLIALIVSLVLG